MIFPIPKKCEQGEGVYIFKKRLADSDLHSFYMDALISEEIRISKDATLGAEAYKMEIDENGVKIKSSCDAGVFRAVTSLFQLYKRGKKEIKLYKNRGSPGL